MVTTLLYLFFVYITYHPLKTLKLVDKENSTPIAYANVILDNKQCIYSDLNGFIKIPYGGKEIRISHICYNDTILSISNIESDSIFLLQKSINLPILQITNKQNKKYKPQKIGYTNYKTCISQGGRTGYELAVYIPYDKKICSNKYIHSIIADLYYDNTPVEGGNIYNADIRFDLRPVKYINGTIIPDNISLISGGLIYNGKKKSGIRIVNLQKPIIFPKNGVFIIAEWIYSKQLPLNDFLDVHVNTTIEVPFEYTMFKDPFITKDKWLYLRNIPEGIHANIKIKSQNKIRNAKLGLIVNK